MTDQKPTIPAWAPPALAEEYRRASADPGEEKYLAILKRLLHPQAEGVWQDFRTMAERAAKAQINLQEQLKARQNSLEQRMVRALPGVYDSEVHNLLCEIRQAVNDLDTQKETRRDRQERISGMATRLKLMANAIDNDQDAWPLNGVLPYIASDAWPDGDQVLRDIVRFVDQGENNAAAAGIINRLEHTQISDLLRRLAGALELEASCEEGVVKSPGKGLPPHMKRRLKAFFMQRYEMPDNRPTKLLIDLGSIVLFDWVPGDTRDNRRNQLSREDFANTKL